jgi:prevent-host-death family protein
MAKKIKKSVGKAQAREEFSLLIETVKGGAGVVEITACGEVVAMLISKQEYDWLCACAKKGAKPQRDPRGTFVLSSDLALEEASREVSTEFENSIENTIYKL